MCSTAYGLETGRPTSALPAGSTMAQRYLSIAVALGATTAFAQQSLYGQCGGVGYTGSTECVAGASCTSYNPYYYQCVAATAAASATTSVSATASSTATTLSTTISSTAVSSATSSVASSTSTAAGSAATQYFITFGDSYSQTGFNVTTGPLPDASDPLGNPPFPGYTTSGANNWIDDLITEYNTTLLLNYNFAYGGATTDTALVAPFEAGILSFVDEIGEFNDSIATHPATTPWTSENTLFGVWMGVNDVGNAYFESNITDIIYAVMVVYFDQLQVLYDAGGRNFVLLSVPPTQETPLFLTEGADVDAQLVSAIDTYNAQLAVNLANFTASNAGIKANIVNTTTPFQTALDNPTAYGAANATCYDADGTTCLWYNDYHPGVAIHELVARAVATAWQGTFFTLNGTTSWKR
ncbi:hypothetical protein BD289DRAFT_444664 [Coniella lustricola]|uniref:CBM1 domain-containing protein n=1 Tax=Coniella lustricola TaxID=2025994 RepID=A0A2T2ZVP7_9PEZI|nr:hypothetical protein BD289DRAFT_444664 [Coniella lustricola]